VSTPGFGFASATPTRVVTRIPATISRII
jgi:hypothetical protein